MENRKRNVQITIRVTEEERALIEKKNATYTEAQSLRLRPKNAH